MGALCQFPVVGLRKGRKGLCFFVGLEGRAEVAVVEGAVAVVVWGAFGSEEEVLEAIAISGGGCEEALVLAASCGGG